MEQLLAGAIAPLDLHVFSCPFWRLFFSCGSASVFVTGRHGRDSAKILALSR